MILITEDGMKKTIKSGQCIVDGQLRLPRNSILTPSARSIIADSKLKLVLVDESVDERLGESKKVLDTAPKMAAKATHKFQLENGGYLDDKPEHMTQVYGKLLVNKDNGRIKLRGQVDLLMGEIMKVQIRAKDLGLKGLVMDLQEICDFIGQMSRSEVLSEELSTNGILGLNHEEIRAMSHNPKKYFGHDHLFNITYELGEIPILLNALRAIIRQVEISCYEAFKMPGGQVERSDLIQGFNRLSSVMYIVIFKYLSKSYEKEI